MGSVLWKFHGINKETPQELTQSPGAAGSVLWKLYGKNKETPLHQRYSGVFNHLRSEKLFRLDSAGGASTFASAAIDAGRGVNDSLVGHADRTHGAGVNAGAASNAFAGNGMSHGDTPYLRA